MQRLRTLGNVTQGSEKRQNDRWRKIYFFQTDEVAAADDLLFSSKIGSKSFFNLGGNRSFRGPGQFRSPWCFGECHLQFFLFSFQFTWFFSLSLGLPALHPNFSGFPPLALSSTPTLCFLILHSDFSCLLECRFIFGFSSASWLRQFVVGLILRVVQNLRNFFCSRHFLPRPLPTVWHYPLVTQLPWCGISAESSEGIQRAVQIDKAAPLPWSDQKLLHNLPYHTWFGYIQFKKV